MSQGPIPDLDLQHWKVAAEVVQLIPIAAYISACSYALLILINIVVFPL